MLDVRESFMEEVRLEGGLKSRLLPGSEVKETADVRQRQTGPGRRVSGWLVGEGASCCRLEQER